MSMVGDPGQRVSDAERQGAVTALRAHWSAGRLDPAEHERRTTAAYSAVTRGDLEALFADLPGGLPTLVQDQPTTAVPAQQPGQEVTEPATGPTGRGGLFPAGSWVAEHRDAIMGVTPFAALALFFVTSTWVWFLLIPAMGAALYAGDDDRDRRGRRRHRH